MSIYNESEEEIQLAIASILKQTSIKMEFIIVIDNPKRTYLYEYIMKNFDHDTRLLVLQNKKNIGLAMSMNKAAHMAKGKYLLRMDADDISTNDRIASQVEGMERKQCELGCGSYDYIDVVGNRINIKVNNYTEREIRYFLPYDCTIHHPTVIIRKDVFDNVGGYRDFPCAQDYDLWLRLYEKNISIHYSEKCLIHYRVRKDSVSSNNKMKQLLTQWYIRSLYFERKKHGKDSFTKAHYEDYLKRNGFFDEKYIVATQHSKIIKDRIDYYKGKADKKFIRVILIFRLLITSRFYRKYYLIMTWCKIMMRYTQIHQLQHVDKYKNYVVC